MKVIYLEFMKNPLSFIGCKKKKITFLDLKNIFELFWELLFSLGAYGPKFFQRAFYVFYKIDER